MIFKDDPEITMFDLNKKNVGGADVYGLLPDDDVKFNGWFADYIFIRGGKFGSTFFNVSDLDLDSCCFCSLYSMYKYCTWLDEDTGIKIQVTYIKECRTEFSASDEDVISW